MTKYKYIGETDEMTTFGKIYNVKANGTFIDDTYTECCLGNDYQNYFKLVNEIGLGETKTLQEKFEVVEPNHKNYLEGLEEIADEFAIDFARYIAKNPKIFNNGSSMEQALSLFKIENNL